MAEMTTMTIPRTHQGVRDLDQVRGRIIPFSGGPAGSAEVNVGTVERVATAVGGAALLLYGLTRRTLLGLGVAALGGGLLARGLSGHCPLYEELGLRTAPGRDAEIVFRA